MVGSGGAGHDCGGVGFAVFGFEFVDDGGIYSDRVIYSPHVLVLGASGCGVFGNDPNVVARAFAAALQRVDVFDHVVFAVLDRTPAKATYPPSPTGPDWPGPPANADSDGR